MHMSLSRRAHYIAIMPQLSETLITVQYVKQAAFNDSLNSDHVPTKYLNFLLDNCGGIVPGD